MLHNHYGLEFPHLHIIGHGVGAHIAGYVGEAIKENGYKTIGKITGLDPSGPYFERMPKKVRLDIGDATYVEVIHTDAEPNGQGIMEAIGHVDFYPNNGYSQPGCNVSKKYPHILKLTRDSLKEGQIYPGCSHKRLFKYYIESIANSNCNHIGFHCNKLHHVFKRTGSSGTYCLDLYKFKISFVSEARNPTQIMGYFDVNLMTGDLVTNMILNEFRFYTKIDSCLENYTYVGWSQPPSSIDYINSARFKWNYEGNSLSITKNSQVHIKRVTISRITTDKSTLNRLCPEEIDAYQLRPGQIELFHLCDGERNQTIPTTTYVIDT
ncbi:hepatic triacylglycerol lipase-like [Ctenocephalides felis]|nr:hepatic triacylglycerol lipase-like [Ctenocephalides felis]